MKKTTRNMTPVCNERGIFMKNVIIGGGTGIFISLLLIYFSLIGEVSFIWLFTFIVASCIFVFYEPRIKSGSATAKGVKIELSEKIHDLEKRTGAMVSKQAEPKEETSETAIRITCEAYATDDKTQSVIKSIGGAKYTFRNIKGIITDSNLPRNKRPNKNIHLTGNHRPLFLWLSPARQVMSSVRR